MPLLVLSTGVEQVAWHSGQPDQRFLDRMTAAEAAQYLADGEFPKGSMGPKIEAAIDVPRARREGGHHHVARPHWRSDGRADRDPDRAAT